MLQFEGYTLDFARSSLRTAERNVQLRPKALEVLRYLVENADRLVTKEELIKAVWPNVTVTEEVLTHCVSEVRQAIGDNRQTIIATVPPRGSRFAAPVSRIATSGAGSSPPPLGGEGQGGGSVRLGAAVPHPSTPTPDPSPAEPRYSEGSATQQSDRSRQQ